MKSSTTTTPITAHYIPWIRVHTTDHLGYIPWFSSTQNSVYGWHRWKCAMDIRGKHPPQHGWMSYSWFQNPPPPIHGGTIVHTHTEEESLNIRNVLISRDFERARYVPWFVPALCTDVRHSVNAAKPTGVAMISLLSFSHDGLTAPWIQFHQLVFGSLRIFMDHHWMNYYSLLIGDPHYHSYLHTDASNPSHSYKPIHINLHPCHVHAISSNRQLFPQCYTTPCTAWL